MVISVLLEGFLLAAQEYNFVRYSTREGLAGSTVYAMVQDQDGYIWFGTETGLSRFDGTHFKNYTSADGLADDEVNQLFVDSKNRVWIISFTNKLCYYYKGKIYTEENDSLLRRLNVRNHVSVITENKRGEIMVGERHHVNVIKPDHSIVRLRAARPDSLFVSHGGLDFDSSFLVATAYDSEYYLSKGVGDSLVIIRDIRKSNQGSANATFISARVRTLYGHDSLVVITPGNEVCIPTPPGLVNLCLVNDSLLGITSLSKTYTYNFLRNKKDRHFFTGKHINSMMEDREGNLWFATVGEGVYRLPSTGFVTWTFIADNQQRGVYSLKKVRDTLWIGTEDFYIWALHAATGRFSKFRLVQVPNSGKVAAIDCLPDGTLLLGTTVGLFYGKGRRFRVARRPSSIKSISVDSNSLVLGTRISAFMYDSSITQYPWPILHSRVTTVYKQDDKLFIGTPGGLYLVKPNRSTQYLAHVHPLFSRRISTLGETEDGTLWVGTYGGGMVGYKANKVIAVLNADGGLTSNIIRAAHIHKNVLWLGTDKGLNKVVWQGGNHRVMRYTTSDGLASDMINAVFADGNKVYVGTNEGLTRFEEDNVFTRSICELRITGIRSDAQPVVSDTNNIFFDHYDNDFRFEFTGISHKSGGEMQYRYRLTGLDTTWRVTRENFLNYPTLPSGKYVLQIQAINKFGVTSKVVTIPFGIEELLQEKLWFRVLVVLLVAGAVWLYIRYQLRRIRRREHLKTETNRKIAELEHMALRAQMNPHFIFNSLNSIQHYVFDKDVEGANLFITEFSRLMRLTMELSTRARISLQEEIKFLTTYLELEKKRFENKFQYRILVDDRIDTNNAFIPPMILQPYIENSIRHGVRYRRDNKGRITVSFSVQEDYLECGIEDNGIGREASMKMKGQTKIEYQSRGMALTARRIEMINQESESPIRIRVEDVYEDGEVAGTRVSIRIPVKDVMA